MPTSNEHRIDPKLSMIDIEPQHIAEDVFVLRAKFHAMWGATLPLNMVILRNASDKSLMIYSPLNPTQYSDLSALGTVTTIVAPAAMHSTYAQKANAHYPSARLISCPSLKKRFPDRDWGTIVTTDTPPDAFGSSFRVALLSPRKEFTEIVVLHEPSNTLVVGDSMFNFTDSILKLASPLMRMYVRLSKGRGPLDLNIPLKWMIRPYCKHYLLQLDSVLQWPWSRVIPCHGGIVDGNAKDVFMSGIYKFVSESAQDPANNSGSRARLNNGVVAALLIIVGITIYKLWSNQNALQ